MSTVKTYRGDRELLRMIRQLQRKVQPTRYSAKRASEGDVIRAGVKVLYAQIAEREAQNTAPQATKNEAHNDKALAA